jgi:hypothetical protein
LIEKYFADGVLLAPLPIDFGSDFADEDSHVLGTETMS